MSETEAEAGTTGGLARAPADGNPGDRGWRLSIDTGGTFTDCLAVAPDGRSHRAKVLSSSSLRGRVATVEGPRSLTVEAAWTVPDGFFVGAEFRLLGADGPSARVAASEGGSGRLELEDAPSGLAAGGGFEIVTDEEAPVLAARLVTGTPWGQPLPSLEMRLATTRGTNALLERKGAATAFFVTEGFADLLEIGNQQRRELFALRVEKPKPLPVAVVEVPERLAADGAVLRPLATGPLEETVRELVARGIRCAAVALLHSYRDPRHEEVLERFLRARGFRQVARSADLAPLIRLLPRAETAVVDAYLAPVIEEYLERVGGAVRRGSLHVMTSAGGLVEAASYRARDSLLSGPAGGVVGAASAGRASGESRVIAFDMGGTSTDVARIDGEYEYRYETRIGGARLVAPALAIETVAAGGGSICWFDGSRLRVGPESAGARPGPACYGAGGPLTLTDVNLLLGRLAADRFEIPISVEAAREAARAVVLAAGAAEDATSGLLEGLLQIADERMADAIRTISVRRGYDPEEYALVAFGGAGGQHACAVADLLRIRRVLVPADAALLSALGLSRAVIERFAQRQVLEPLERVARELEERLATLEEEAVRSVVAEGVPPGEVDVRRRLAYLRLAGQGGSLEVAASAGEGLEGAFAEAYEATYGYPPPARAVEVESLRVVASSRPRELEEVAGEVPLRRAAPEGEGRVVADGRPRSVTPYERPALEPASRFEGPAIVLERHSATWVPAGWSARVDSAGALVLDREEEP